MSDGIRAMWMRGGTSKGGYFLASDLPADTTARDAALLRIMGSPDIRQIDGMGGADPLTSKVAIVQKSQRDGVDVDYLFLQVFVDQAIVTDAQNCGNILAGVGPFAIERGLVSANDGETSVTIFMENTGQISVATVQTPNGRVSYRGDARIDGTPGTSAPVPIEFQDTAGSSCGALLPTGNIADTVNALQVTMIDNGMPCVVLKASDMGITGSEAPDELENNEALRETHLPTAAPFQPARSFRIVVTKQSAYWARSVLPRPVCWKALPPMIFQRSGAAKSGLCQLNTPRVR